MSTLLVLAAGMGSRYGGLKQLDAMGPGGETVLDYSVFDAIRAGFTHVVFAIRKDFAEDFKKGVGSRFADQIKVDYAYQELDDLPEPFEVPAGREKPWGTAHAVRAARDVIDGPFAVINADDFYGKDSYEKAAQLLQTCSEDQCGLIAYPLVNTLSDHGRVNRGVCEVSEQGILESIEEFVEIEKEDDGALRGEGLNGKRVSLPRNIPVSMNFWVFPASFMKSLEGLFISFLEEKRTQEKSECFIPTAVDSLITQGSLSCQVVKTDSSWFGVTYPEDKIMVVQSITQLIDSGVYPKNL